MFNLARAQPAAAGKFPDGDKKISLKKVCSFSENENQVYNQKDSFATAPLYHR